MVERASERAIYQEMRTGRRERNSPRQCCLEAVKETKPSTAEWLETARSYATYSNKAGLYDDLVAYFEKVASAQILWTGPVAQALAGRVDARPSSVDPTYFCQACLIPPLRHARSNCPWPPTIRSRVGAACGLFRAH